MKKIDGLKTEYYISIDGTVTNKKGNVINQHIDRKGYLKVILFNGTVNSKTKRKNLTIHRLIANAFIENPFNKPYINHINGIKTDNSILNLEWCTQKENIKHAHETGLTNMLGEKNQGAVVTEIQVLKIREKGKYSTYRKIASDNNISLNALVCILKRKTWKHI